MFIHHFANKQTVGCPWKKACNQALSNTGKQARFDRLPWSPLLVQVNNNGGAAEYSSWLPPACSYYEINRDSHSLAYLQKMAHMNFKSYIRHGTVRKWLILCLAGFANQCSYWTWVSAVCTKEVFCVHRRHHENCRCFLIILWMFYYICIL